MGEIEILTSFNLGIDCGSGSPSFGLEGVDKLEDADVVDVEEDDAELEAYEHDSCCNWRVEKDFTSFSFVSSLGWLLVPALYLSSDFILPIGELNLDNDLIFLN